jgi:hypothetical protein
MNMSWQDLVLRALPLTEGIEESGGPNRGRAVDRMLKRTGAPFGSPWCAAFVAEVGKTLLGDLWKIPVTASCDVMLIHARAHNILRDDPAPAAVFLVMKTHTDAIHTGFVTGVDGNKISTIEGNTNDGGSREGTGVYKRTRTHAPGKLKYIYWWLL